MNIDNSLEEKQVKGKNVFQNRTNAFKVSLPCDLSSDDVIEIENAGYSISFNLELPGLKDSGKIISAKMDSKNLLQSPKDKNSAFDAVDFDKLSSEIIYNSVDKNTNLEYIVTADGLKENIVLTKKPEKSISYTYILNVGELSARQNDDRSIELFNAEEITIFLIQPPIMYDKNFNSSNNISINTEVIDDGLVKLTYVPSYEWLNSSNREYPVVVDPVITVNVNDSSTVIQDAELEITSPYSSATTGLICAVGNDAGSKRRSYFKVNVSELYNNIAGINVNPSATVIISAKLNVWLASTTGSMKVTANPVSTAWNESSFSYSLMSDDVSLSNNVNESMYDYVCINPDMAEERVTFDISKAVINNSNLDGFCGVMLKSYDESADNNIAYFVTSEFVYDTSYCPTFEIDYRVANNADGICDSFSLPCKRAGNMFVNDFSQEVYITRDDLGIDGVTMPVLISFNYNSTAYKRYCSNGAQYEMRSFGAGWLTNYNRYIIVGTDNDVEYADENGDIIVFKLSENNSENQIYNEIHEYATPSCDRTLYIPNISGEYVAYVTEGGETTFFGYDFRAAKIVNSNNEHIDIEYVPNTHLFSRCEAISKITDGSGREYRFNYNSDDKLTSIVCYNNIDGNGYVQTTVPGTSGSVPLSRTYAYTGDKLTSVGFPDGESVRYSYTTDGIQMINIDGYSLK